MASKFAFLFSFLLLLCLDGIARPDSPALRFGGNGQFKILQVADMHYADGKTTACQDVLPDQVAGCSDLNTTAFVRRMIRVEKPDLIVFTGDNIFGLDATDAGKSLDAAFAPAVSSSLPWAAVLGNHDQESTLSREGVMKYIVRLPRTLATVNPTGADGDIDGFGNYNLEVAGADGSSLQNKSVLNLYFLDSGDYSTVPSIPGYGWIKPTQQVWFQRTSSKLQDLRMRRKIGGGSEHGGLYYLDQEPLQSIGAALYIRDSPVLWHRRLGHPSLQILQKTVPLLVVSLHCSARLVNLANIIGLPFLGVSLGLVPVLLN